MKKSSKFSPKVRERGQVLDLGHQLGMVPPGQGAQQLSRKKCHGLWHFPIRRHLCHRLWHKFQMRIFPVKRQHSLDIAIGKTLLL